MGKKVKTGKSRKDKFYHLAKETGYRARSAFKLIQLNRKFNFLQESRVLIDLCAAPGGWLQVASNFMPMSSIIIGVDLVSIKPINKVTTIQSDITTDHCRQSLKKELKSWNADVVLNDGAPNVGQAWVQDAFSQAQLALSALKLASEHLRKGGWFITKVFRSKDYTALLWVFNQLFKKVHATKPQASRNESAEIFVVCEGYLKPDKLDDKFLDPKHVFKEIQEDSKVRLNILRPEKVTRQREGYAENNVSLHTTITAADFVNSQNAIDILSTTNKITIKDASILNHKATTAEVKICCEDIKVLGRKEIKLLFSWRKKLRMDLKLDAEPDEEVIEEITKTEEEKEEEKEEELDQTIADLKKEELKDVKKKKKRVREQKKKLRERLASKLNDANGDICADEQDLFALSQIQNKKHLESVEDAKEVNFESESELEFEDSEDSEDEEYTYGDDELYEKPAAKKSKASQELLEKKTKKKDKRRNVENPLLVDEDEIESGVKKSEEEVQLERAQQWFQKDIFKDVDDSDDDDYDIEQFATKVPKKKSKNVEAAEEMDLEEAVEEAEVEDSDSDSGVDSEIDDRSISQGKKDVKSAEKAAHEENQQNKKVSFEVAPQQNGAGGTLGPEALALGTAMVTSRKRKRDIIEEGFNRYSFNDNGLPSWFIEDEVKHTTRHLPVTREEVDFYKQRMREINARPIKKVIEAKAKKKSQMLKKLDRARRKAEGILDADTTSQEKQSQIKSIYKKAGLLKKKKEEVKYVVAKKSQAGKKIPRPAGVKGRYKIVDPRMKKDLKAAKAKEKTHGRKKRK